MTGLVPISPNTDQLRILERIDQWRQASIATYAKKRASPKTYGQAITPETVNPSGKDLERRLRDDFKSANKDSKPDIAGPDPDSDAIHELLMDIDSDSDESQVDIWSGGIPGGIPQTTTAAPEADDHID
jgi:hypothetical protein